MNVFYNIGKNIKYNCKNLKKCFLNFVLLCLFFKGKEEFVGFKMKVSRVCV